MTVLQLIWIVGSYILGIVIAMSIITYGIVNKKDFNDPEEGIFFALYPAMLVLVAPGILPLSILGLIGFFLLWVVPNKIAKRFEEKQSITQWVEKMNRETNELKVELQKIGVEV